MNQIKALIQTAVQQLQHSDSPQLDAQLLMAHALEVDRVWVMTWSDKEIEQTQEAAFLDLLARRIAGEPIAYILGQREFWGRDFFCNENTLIPRPDTEILIEQVLGLDLPQQASVLDLGTGTGCIALTLAAERPEWQVVALDYSMEAMKVAEKNKAALKLNNVQIQQSDWYQALPDGTEFDLIVANPPYIDPASPYLKEGDVRFEPELALTSSDQGLDALQTVTGLAPKYLKKGGWLAVEHGFDQAKLVYDCMSESGFRQIRQVPDLAGLDRCSYGCLT